MPLVGFVLIAMAAGTIITVLYLVTREKLEHEEWYIPPQPGSSASAPVVTPTAQPGTTSVPTPAPVAVPPTSEAVKDAADASKSE